MKLSKKETENLLSKLRGRYDDYARNYSEQYFNREEFERRYLYAQQNRMDLSAFLLAEVSNFEKLKESFDTKQNKHSFSEQVDRVIEEQLERLKSYPKREFHPRAGIEESHMYGALVLLAEHYFPVVRIISTDLSLRNHISRIEERISQFVLPSAKKLAPRTEDHALILSRRGVTELEIEKSKNNYLKEAAFLLNDVIEFCESLMESKVDGLDMPIQFSRSHESGKRKKILSQNFSSLTGYGAVMKIRDYCAQVISDFRLSAFRAR